MRSIHLSIVARLLLAVVLPVALMIASTCARAQVVGANGMNGADCSTNFCMGGNGTDGESVTANGGATGGAGGNGGNAYVSTGPFFYGTGGNGGNGGSASASGPNATAIGGDGGGAGNFLYNGSGGVGGNGGDATANGSGSVTATGGAGGEGIDDPFIGGSGAGGNAIAISGAMANGSDNAISSATATGGGTDVQFLVGGSATATSSATANGSGRATASASATMGVGAYYGVANAISNATTAKGGLAQAQSTTVGSNGGSQSTAKTTFGGVSVQSTVESFGGSTEAIAQGGLGQSAVNPEQSAFVFSTALPNTAYATTLIGSANNVADALLGSDDKIFGTAILGGGGSSTFDFSFRGDLILGDVGDNSINNLGFISGPIDLTIEGNGVFAFGAAVPETSTWAMMLIGFAGMGFAGYRNSRRTVGGAASKGRPESRPFALSDRLLRPQRRNRRLSWAARHDRGQRATEMAKGNRHGRRSLVETTMGRYKRIIGPQLRARSFAGQQTEAAIGVAVLNRMLEAGRPDSVREPIQRWQHHERDRDRARAARQRTGQDEARASDGFERTGQRSSAGLAILLRAGR